MLIRKYEIFLFALLLASLSFAEVKEGENEVIIRGKEQYIYFYHSTGSTKQTSRILFAPGDGGWRGFAITIAEVISSFGYDVYGLDTKRYLESFTGKTTLKEPDIMGDFKSIADWITPTHTTKITLIGWSEGGGLCLLAAASPKNKDAFDGLITIGLNETTEMGWRWTDDFTYFSKRNPREPTFSSAAYIVRIAPVPLLMIQSTGDEYVSVDTAKKMFALAPQPKQFVLIDANNHRFDSNQKLFFDKLKEALQWIHQIQ